MTTTLPLGTVLRVARPTDHLTAIAALYADGLGFSALATFEDHQGFDGVILGHPEWPYHLEFTTHRGQRVGPAPSQDHLLVFYLPEPTAWEHRCAQMIKAGFREVAPYNPYWRRAGRTFEDLEGYRVVLSQESWVG